MPNVIDSRPPAPLRYAKHANSLKDIKPNKMGTSTSNSGYLMDMGDSIRSKLFSNGSSSRAAAAVAATTSNVDSSMNFTRPLKTSTAVCLNDLRGRMAEPTSASKQSRANVKS